MLQFGLLLFEEFELLLEGRVAAVELYAEFVELIVVSKLIQL